MDIIPSALLLTKVDGKGVLATNAMARSLLGWSPEIELAPDWWPARAHALGSLGEIDNNPTDFDAELKRSDGKMISAVVSVRSINVDGEACFIFAVRDISREKLAEKRLMESRETFRLLFETAPVAMNLTRVADGVISFCNARMAQMLESTPQDILGRVTHSFYENNADREALRQTLLDFGVVENYLVKLKTLKGTSIWVRMDVKMIEVAGEAMFLVGGLDVTEQKNMELKLQELASTDARTQLLNRRRFLEMTQDCIAHVERYGGNFSLAVLEIDHWKSVGDAYGLAAADSVIKAIGAHLKTQIADKDFLAALGGGEFALALPDRDLEKAQKILEAIRTAVETFKLRIGTEEVPLAISGGLAQWQKHETIEELMSRIDGALHMARTRGHNCVVAAANLA